MQRFIDYSQLDNVLALYQLCSDSVDFCFCFVFCLWYAWDEDQKDIIGPYQFHSVIILSRMKDDLAPLYFTVHNLLEYEFEVG